MLSDRVYEVFDPYERYLDSFVVFKCSIIFSCSRFLSFAQLYNLLCANSLEYRKWFCFSRWKGRMVQAPSQVDSARLELSHVAGTFTVSVPLSSHQGCRLELLG